MNNDTKNTKTGTERSSATTRAVRAIDEVDADWKANAEKLRRTEESLSLTRRMRDEALRQRDVALQQNATLQDKVAKLDAVVVFNYGRLQLERKLTDAAHHERDALKAERDALKAERDALKAEHDRLKAERDASNEWSNYARAVSARHNTEARLLANKTTLASTEAELSKVRVRLVSVEAERDRLQGRVVELEKRLAAGVVYVVGAGGGGGVVGAGGGGGVVGGGGGNR